MKALDWWRINLRSRNLSKRTIEVYELAVTQLLDHLKSEGHPSMSSRSAQPNGKERD